VWTTGSEFGQGSEAWLIDFASGTRRSLGPARLAGYTRDGRIIVAAGSNENFIVDPATGRRSPAAGAEFAYFSTNPQPFPPLPYIIAPDVTTAPDVRTFSVRERATGALLLTFDGVAAAPADREHIAAVSAPVDGRSNIYLVELATGATQFITPATPTFNMPLSADDRAIVWTDAFCGDPPGSVKLYDRSRGELTRLDLSSVGANVNARYAKLVPGGQIAIGSFGAALLVDRDSLTFNASIPMRPDGYGGDISWSANYKYASRGVYGGHGGLC
jgi:hypothetical protein